jgi:hypothetical protein
MEERVGAHMHAQSHHIGTLRPSLSLEATTGRCLGPMACQLPLGALRSLTGKFLAPSGAHGAGADVRQLGGETPGRTSTREMSFERALELGPRCVAMRHPGRTFHLVDNRI